jgi:hypothetical protein
VSQVNRQEMMQTAYSRHERNPQFAYMAQELVGETLDLIDRLNALGHHFVLVDMTDEPEEI